MAIGMPIMQDIEREFQTDSQVYDFRKSAIETVKNAIKERDRKGINGTTLYSYPPDICDSANLPPNIYGSGVGVHGVGRGQLSTQLIRSNSPSTSNLSISRSSCSLKSILTSKDSQCSGPSTATTTAKGGAGGGGNGSGGSRSGGSSGGGSDGGGTSGAPDLHNAESLSLTSSLFRPSASLDQSDNVSTCSFEDGSLNVESLSLCDNNSEYRRYNDDQPVCVWYPQRGDNQSNQNLTVQVSISRYPIDLVQAVVRKRLLSMHQVPPERYEEVTKKFKHAYILKVCGQELYLTSEDYPLCQYRYIRNCLANNTIPQLMLVLRDSFQQELKDCVFRVPNFMRRPKAVKHIPSSRRDCLSLWNLESTMKYKASGVI